MSRLLHQQRSNNLTLDDLDPPTVQNDGWFSERHADRIVRLLGLGFKPTEVFKDIYKYYVAANEWELTDRQIKKTRRSLADMIACIDARNVDAIGVVPEEFQ